MTAGEIVRQLAIDGPTRGEVDGTCVCGIECDVLETEPEDHASDCLWRIAVEWVEDNHEKEIA